MVRYRIQIKYSHKFKAYIVFRVVINDIISTSPFYLTSNGIAGDSCIVTEMDEEQFLRLFQGITTVFALLEK